MVFVQVALDRLDSRGSKVADYLLVIDMQSDYVAVGKAYHEELIAAVNDKIASYPSDRVIYILNRFFWERKDRKKKFATGLLLVSSRIFEKRRASCFTNSDLKDFLEGNGAKSIEFIGAVSRLPFWQLSRRIIRFLSICPLSELPTRRNLQKHCISGILSE